MFFWFFEARKNPKTAPLAFWVSGGIGYTGLAALFQEHGPCKFPDQKSTKPVLNPNSWNEYANMIYLDQPLGTGFSPASDVPINKISDTPPYIWKFLQAFYEILPEYKGRDLGMFASSYGGQYLPEFYDYFKKQNSAIQSGTLKGEVIKVSAVGINNGLFRFLTQGPSLVTYAVHNPYKALITQEQGDAYLVAYKKYCFPYVTTCETSGNQDDCRLALDACYDVLNNKYLGAVISPEINYEDVRQSGPPGTDFAPYDNFIAYLQDPTIMKAIGAVGNYTDQNLPIQIAFQNTGDFVHNSVPKFSAIVADGVQVLAWAGDADFSSEWNGILGVANQVVYKSSAAFQAAQLAPYTLNGKEVGQFKKVDNFSFLKVYKAGSQLAAFQPEVALQVFKQLMEGKNLYNT